MGTSESQGGFKMENVTMCLFVSKENPFISIRAGQCIDIMISYDIIYIYNILIFYHDMTISPIVNSAVLNSIFTTLF